MHTYKMSKHILSQI